MTHTISQICVVSRDMEKTVHEYQRRLGWTDWSVFEYTAPLLHDTYLRGVPTDYEMFAAETMVNGLGFEVIQPTKGNSIYHEFIEEHGEGVHHLAVMKHTREQSLAFLEAIDAPKLMSGRIGDNIEFYYLDTELPLKVSIESGTGHAIELKPTRYIRG